MGRRLTPVLDRINARIEIEANDCWIWQGALIRGYGVMTLGSRSAGTRRFAQVHRVAYEELVGPIPEGLELDHLCRTTACCNPDHLEPVTQYENNRRSSSPTAVNRRKTHCLQGHPLSGDNLFVNVRGHRVCRTCRYEQGARYRADLWRQAPA